MTHRYVVGGAAFVTDEHLAGLETSGFADVELRVHFSFDFESCAADHPDARAVAGPTGTSGVVAPVAHECWLPDLAGDPLKRAWHLRQMAPVFGAAVGRLVLHAGAVAIPAGVVGLMGESGAGKSTLARFLADCGQTFVADDLLPIRFTPAVSSPVGIHLLPLSALFVLSRAETPRIRTERLDPIPALQGLVEQGFGEHGDSDVWAFQFGAYHRVAEAVPIFSLTIPDDVSALPRVRQAVVTLATGDGADSSISGAG